mmetsp:Transcript_8189/g.14024  ORF Transcript_8189/g.14024 Transcript_8189/m.14024 type:complete len:300 (-) Transcript_8189:366-1265(-)
MRSARHLRRTNHSCRLILHVGQLGPQQGDGAAYNHVRHGGACCWVGGGPINGQQLLCLCIVGHITLGVSATPPLASARTRGRTPGQQRHRRLHLRSAPILLECEPWQLLHEAQDARDNKPVSTRRQQGGRHSTIPHKVLFRALRRGLGSPGGITASQKRGALGCVGEVVEVGEVEATPSSMWVDRFSQELQKCLVCPVLAGIGASQHLRLHHLIYVSATQLSHGLGSSHHDEGTTCMQLAHAHDCQHIHCAVALSRHKLHLSAIAVQVHDQGMEGLCADTTCGAAGRWLNENTCVLDGY